MHPFSFSNILHYTRGLISSENSPAWAFGLVFMFINHVAAAPQLWRGLGIIVLFLILVDFILGVMRCLVVGRRLKENPVNFRCTFNSRDMGSTLIKMIVYGVLFLLFMGIDFGVAISIGSSLSGAFFLSGLALAAIAGRELTSVFENARDICRCIKEPWIFECVETLASKMVLALGKKFQSVAEHAMEESEKKSTE